MKILLIGLCMAIFSMSYAQESELDNFAKVELGFHGLSVGYEVPLSNKFLLNATVGLGLGASVQGNSVDYVLLFDMPAPFIKGQLKYVYNIERRISRYRNVDHNSGNYIGIQTKYSLGNLNTSRLNEALLLEAHWGFQRSLGGRFLFNFHVGLGYIHDYYYYNDSVTPTLGAIFGYRIF